MPEEERMFLDKAWLAGAKILCLGIFMLEVELVFFPSTSVIKYKYQSHLQHQKFTHQIYQPSL